MQKNFCEQSVLKRQAAGRGLVVDEVGRIWYTKEQEANLKLYQKKEFPL